MVVPNDTSSRIVNVSESSMKRNVAMQHEVAGFPRLARSDCHHRIVARQPGLKGWLRSNTPDIKYSTAMHYKKLATRLRQLIGLDARGPLEWLLPDNAEDLSALSPADRKAAIFTAGSKTLTTTGTSYQN